MSKKRLQSRQVKCCIVRGTHTHHGHLGQAVCKSDARILDLLLNVSFNQRTEDLQNRTCESI